MPGFSPGRAIGRRSEFANFNELRTTFNKCVRSARTMGTHARHGPLRPDDLRPRLRRARARASTARRCACSATRRPAQDVAQDVFLRVWRRPGTFDARRGELGAYLRLMARSRALDLWRERARPRGRATDRLKIVVAPRRGRAPRTSPSRASSATSTARRVRAALGVLPEPQREAVVLAYWGGLTADEIAARARACRSGRRRAASGSACAAARGARRPRRRSRPPSRGRRRP